MAGLFRSGTRDRSAAGGRPDRRLQVREIRDIEDLLDRLTSASEGRERISVDFVLKTAGRRSFGSLLLLAGIILVSPLSGIPTVPTTIGVIVLLLTGQLLLGRSEFWMPRFLLRRSIARTRLDTGLRAVRPVARFVDRLLRPRLSFVTDGPGVYAIAAFCLLVAAVTPFLEILPFAASGAGAGLSFFGLALISHDGALAILTFTVSIAAALVLAGFFWWG